MSDYPVRLQAFREELHRLGLDGFIVPRTDEHLSENVGDYAERLAWLAGFTGSMGTSVVLADMAALFVDGRYLLQAQTQVDKSSWNVELLPKSNIAQWISKHAPSMSVIGYDPWLHTANVIRDIEAVVGSAGVRLVPVTSNPVDSVWSQRPQPSSDKVVVHPMWAAGKAWQKKREEIVSWIAENGCDAVVLCALDSIAWTFNIRGTDVRHTPVSRSFALIFADGHVELFVAPEKVDDALREHLGNVVRLLPYSAFEGRLRDLNGLTVAVDPERTVLAILRALEAAGAEPKEIRDPVVLWKSIKNEVEIAGHRAAQERDAVALARFLYFVATALPKEEVDEVAAATILRTLREESGLLKDLSFDTISAAGPNSALPHYRPTSQNAGVIGNNQIYMVDSGGQYVDGTTDVTRTVIIGQPTLEMKNRFTRVLKGNIALTRAVFPVGTTGIQLDVLARQFLWSVGLDFPHGTGHGVGSYLCVHEGPLRIAVAAAGLEPLRPGMIVSNEPAYYKSGEYGMRIENLLLVVPRKIPGAEQPMLGFEVLTFAPIDRNLIDLELLSVDERDWIDKYHANVVEIVFPKLQDKEVRDWLCDVARPLNGRELFPAQT